MTTISDTSAVTAAALARLHAYLNKAIPYSEADELIARDAYINGFQQGCRWAIQTTARLSNPEFREAIAVLAEVVGSDREAG